MTTAAQIPEERSQYGRDIPIVGVHALSEQVFCNRAGILAQCTGQDEGQEGEPNLGPKLDWLGDYDEKKFAEAIEIAWGELRYWGTLLAVALASLPVIWLIVASGWGRGRGFLAVWVGCAPALYCGAQAVQSISWLIRLIRERAVFDRSNEISIDFDAEEVREVNWWSLRKAGFDCRAPVDPYFDPTLRLAGKPWRVLIKDRTIRIPVVYKRRGDRSWGPQHLARIAAYCHLIESQEGAESPFGILMFAGSYDCLIIPNTLKARSTYRQALEALRELLVSHARELAIAAGPRDNRCRGCHWGAPRRQTETSQTMMNGKPVSPKLAKGKDGAWRHSPCADVFGEIPPHADAIELEMTLPREGLPT